ncbi:MAG: sialate O-acetylesterase [Spirochaetota bacterium]
MKLSCMFTDHAVLQRNSPVPVWGWTKPLAAVRAKMGAYEAQTLSGADGKFVLRFPPMPAGGPYTLTASSDEGAVTVKDVLIGEVWLASGQSNMEWKLAGCGKAGEDEARGANHPRLRMINFPKVTHLSRQTDIEASWDVCTPSSVLAFSAVGYYFAKRLMDTLDCAVGIINSSWGGTYIEAWTSRETLVRNPDMSALVHRYEANVNSPAFWAAGNENKDPFPADPGNTGEAKGWAKAEFSDSAWRTMELPMPWQSAGFNHSGVFWFRKAVDIPASLAGKDIVLCIGAVDKMDTAYFNGERVGATGAGFEQQHWNLPREYRVPGRLVKAGKNVIAVRAYSFIYHGGMIGPSDWMRIRVKGAKDIPLAGTWRFEIEHDLGLVSPPLLKQGPGNPNSPYILFDSMIAPIVPYALRGAIWYQGESNASRASEYARLMRDMIRCWRYEWGYDLSFLIVELANYMSASPYQEGSTWARLREAQNDALAEVNTGIAVAIDIGEANDIHPKNKGDVGSRLAQWALARTYGMDIVPSGPLYAGMTIEGASIRLSFSNIGKGLSAKGGVLKTFYIAGADRVFRPADTAIDGSTIIVKSAAVVAPVAVRYAWADNPEGCNLYNADGLPASPFRTDRW